MISDSFSRIHVSDLQIVTALRKLAHAIYQVEKNENLQQKNVDVDIFSIFA